VTVCCDTVIIVLVVVGKGRDETGGGGSNATIGTGSVSFGALVRVVGEE